MQPWASISLDEGTNPSFMGTIAVLEQLGISFELGADRCSDIRITDADARARPGQHTIRLCTGAEGVRSAGAVTLGDTSFHHPESAKISRAPAGLSVVASTESGVPVVVGSRQETLILTDVPAFLASGSTLRLFDQGFSENLGWDGWRTFFLAVLVRAALSRGQGIARVWYFPSLRFTTAAAFTTDIDHQLAWRIISRHSRLASESASLGPALPRFIRKALALSVAKKYYSRRRFERLLAGQGVPGPRLLAPVWPPAPDVFYRASIHGLVSAGIPVTAFLRSAEFQKEERIDADFPEATGKMAYQPGTLPGVDVGLHFGATVGKTTLGDEVVNPYSVEPWGDSIPDQLRFLERSVGHGVVGSRMHHIYGFNQKMFEVLDSCSTRYDASVFGAVGGLPTRLTPNGCTHPYRPILTKDGDSPRFARYVEIPSLAYETAEMPFELARKYHSYLVISEHPDRVESRMIERFVGFVQKHRDSVWLADLSTISAWWEARRRVRMTFVGGRISLRNLPSDGSVCVACEPGNTIPSFDDDITVLDGIGGVEERRLDVRRQ